MSEQEELKEKIDKTKKLLDKLDEMLAEDKITEAKYKQLSKKYRDEVDSLKNQIAEGTLKQEFGIKTEEVGGITWKVLFAVAMGVLLLGYWALAPGESNAPENLKLKTFTNSIGIEFVLIPAGEFNMGSPSNDNDRENDEGPVHRVKIANAFYVGKYEVTQKQWRDVMGTDISFFKGDNLPVEQVSWNDVQEFIKKLNEKEGTNKYRLPSEAEWEYAARAGTTTRYSFGDDKSKLGEYAWYNANSDSKTHEVGQKKPNPWGLYDIHGNVWEWVQDIYHYNYNGAPTDGSSWESWYSSWFGSNRVIRGGGWDCAKCNREAIRFVRGPGVRDDYLGFRLLSIS